MKLIRRIAVAALVTFSAFGAMTYTSCNKDECKDVVCQNGGTCNSDDGSCACATGYEGTTCETAVRAKFVKTWTATDQKTDGTNISTYLSPVAAGTAITDIKIGNFSNLFDNDVLATVSGNTITIATQEPDNDGYTVSGTGNYNATDKKITWTYTLTSPLSGAQSYSGTWQ